MNDQKNYFKFVILSFGYVLTSLTPVWADDIEVYFNNPNATTNQAAKPNVLFVFDTSGSSNSTMNSGLSRREAAITAVTNFPLRDPVEITM
jgi:hypothetical protein